MILVPVSTKATQGQRRNDFSWVPSGQLVHPSWTCTNATADDHCGCARCLTGFENGKGTTTVKVAQVKMTEREYIDALTDSLMRTGVYAASERAKARRAATPLAHQMLRGVAPYNVGDVLEYRDGRFGRRSSKARELSP